MLIGLVGKPNTGKSTFFKACTLANVEIGNRPFVKTLKKIRQVKRKIKANGRYLLFINSFMFFY